MAQTRLFTKMSEIGPIAAEPADDGTVSWPGGSGGSSSTTTAATAAGWAEPVASAPPLIVATLEAPEA